MSWFWNKVYALSQWLQKQYFKHFSIKFETMGDRLRKAGFKDPRKALHLNERGVKGPVRQKPPKIVTKPPVKDANEILLNRAQAQYSTGGYSLQQLADDVKMPRGKLTKEFRKRGVKIHPKGKRLTTTSPFPKNLGENHGKDA